jgi:hypothetical protein
MAYEYETDPDVLSHKTGRIAILSVLMAFLGILFFAYKVDACKDKPADASCREEFFEMKSGDYDNNQKCRPGAVIEMVNSPPAPKAGIMCHCPAGTTPTTAPSK